MKKVFLNQQIHQLIAYCIVFFLCFSISEGVKAQPTYDPITVNSKLFTDNIWFFGAPDATGVTTWPECPSVTFVKNASEQWVSQSLPTGKRGKVTSWENSLSVSTPSCDGEFIFYTMHNRVYNSNHGPMKGGINSDPITNPGYFSGHTSVADGLAACYVGNNKYILISCTEAYGATTGLGYLNVGLNYYFINMGPDQDGGRGVLSAGGTIHSRETSESIELIPAATGVDNEYWLIYHHFKTGEMIVRKVNSSGVSSTIHRQITTTDLPAQTTTFLLKSNATYNKLALSAPGNQRVYLFDFDPRTGDIKYNHYISKPANFSGSVYGVEFSPLGNYLYFASYYYADNNSYKMFQYDLATKSIIGSFNYNNTYHADKSIGSGMKRGTDGKIYVSRAGSKYLGIIETPDIPVTNTTLWSYKGNSNDGLDVGIVYDNLPLSTGITPPAVDPTDISKTPTTINKTASTTNTMPITVDVLTGDHSNNTTATKLEVSKVFLANPLQGNVDIDATKKKVIFTPSFSYPFTDGEKVNVIYVAKDDGKPINMCSNGQLEVTVHTTFSSQSKLFSDNVWFFGRDWSGNGSPQVIFKNDGANNWIPQTESDSERKAQVRSWENSLSVSTPACDGSFVFYTSHEYVYNSNHQPMEGYPRDAGKKGYFWGHTSVADGLGACYIGNNKYFLISSTSAYEDSDRGLRYYIIDMDKDNGLGEIRNPSAADGITQTPNGIIESTGMSESVEIIPIPSTSDQYWLVYHMNSPKEMRVRKITPQGVSNVLNDQIASKATDYTYVLSSNTQHTMLALVLPNYGGGAKHCITYNFDPTTGKIAHRYTFDLAGKVSSVGVGLYGTLFSPNGRYLYVSEWQNTRMHQFDLFNNSYVGYFNYSDRGATENGGGMKLGPDGKIYVARSFKKYLGFIETPNEPVYLNSSTPNPAFVYKMNGLDLKLGTETYNNLPLSTGLTPPSLDPPGTNLTPKLKPDAVTATTINPTIVKPLDNDTWDESSNASQLYLTNAKLVNSADIAKGTVMFDSDAKTVTFTPNQSYTFTDGETIVISYTARDNQTPIGMCDNSTITLTMKVPQLTVTIPSPKQFNEGTKPTVKVCLPDGVKAPNGGITVNLAQVTSTAPMAISGADYTMPATVAIAQNTDCISFEVDLKNDTFIEGNETLKIEASAVNCKNGNDELKIIDRTVGDIEVVAIPTEVTEGAVAKFQIRFKEAGVTCTKDVEVKFTISGLATSPDNYTISHTSPVTLDAGHHSIDITVTTKGDYVVDGGRNVTLLITEVNKLGTP